MTVNPFSSTVDALSITKAAETTSSSSQTASTSTTSTGVNQNEFLTLLVAQLKNQDPMNPTDSAQFMGELAQFSTLQEVIGVHQDLNSLLSASGVTTPQA